MTVVASTLVDSGGNSRQWWPILTVVESTVVDSSGQEFGVGGNRWTFGGQE